MTKCLIDIGTNSFGGYEKLFWILNMDDTWGRVFIEPNPEHLQNITERIKSIPNSKFYQVAITDENKDYKLITRDDIDGDSAATIMGLNFIDLSIGESNQQFPRYLTYEVEGKRLEDIFKENEADEYYVKMDCEGAEFQILENFPFKYLDKIKRMFVEFHSHDDYARGKQNKIINDFALKNFTIENWD